MKKPVINLTAIERIDAMPLRKAVEYLKKELDDVANSRAREAALKREIDEYLATIDPADEKAVGLITAKKTQLDILPILITKKVRQLEDRALPALLAETEKFKIALVRFYESAYQATAEQLAEQFRVYFADPEKASHVALQADDCRAISVRIHEAASIPLTSQAPRLGHPQAVASLIQAAEQFLALASRA